MDKIAIKVGVVYQFLRGEVKHIDNERKENAVEFIMYQFLRGEVKQLHLQAVQKLHIYSITDLCPFQAPKVGRPLHPKIPLSLDFPSFFKNALYL